METMDRLLLKPQEAARLLGVSLSRVYQLIGSGAVPHVRLGGTTLRIPLEALRKMISDEAGKTFICN